MFCKQIRAAFVYGKDAFQILGLCQPALGITLDRQQLARVVHGVQALPALAAAVPRHQIQAELQPSPVQGNLKRAGKGSPPVTGKGRGTLSDRAAVPDPQQLGGGVLPPLLQYGGNLQVQAALFHIHRGGTAPALDQLVLLLQLAINCVLYIPEVGREVHLCLGNPAFQGLQPLPLPKIHEKQKHAQGQRQEPYPIPLFPLFHLCRFLSLSPRSA